MTVAGAAGAGAALLVSERVLRLEVDDSRRRAAADPASAASVGLAGDRRRRRRCCKVEELVPVRRRIAGDSRPGLPAGRHRAPRCPRRWSGPLDGPISHQAGREAEHALAAEETLPVLAGASATADETLPVIAATAQAAAEDRRRTSAPSEPAPERPRRSPQPTRPGRRRPRSPPAGRGMPGTRPGQTAAATWHPGREIVPAHASGGDERWIVPGSGPPRQRSDFEGAGFRGQRQRRHHRRRGGAGACRRPAFRRGRECRQPARRPIEPTLGPSPASATPSRRR